MKYIYTFAVWPDETWGFSQSVFQLFRMLNMHVEMEFTQEEFERFRSDISHIGLTLREVQRRLDVEWETLQ